MRAPSVQEIGDLFAIRLALERYVLECLAGRLTREQIRRVRENPRSQQQAAQRASPRRRAQPDR